jgi:HK97 family phage major capsid protein/HK97 family phage prohead protease
MATEPTPSTASTMRSHLTGEPPAGHGVDAASVSDNMPQMAGTHDSKHDSGADHTHGAGRSTERYTPAPYKAEADETVKCPDCGKMNDTDAHFCDQCGASLPGSMPYSPGADETVKCPKCGKMNAPDATYCDQCGFDMVTGENSAPKTGESRTTPPRENLVRASFPGVELRASANPNGMPTLVGHLAVFNQWTKIDSAYEGRFMERIAPGAFARTIANNRDQMKATFQHGKDPQLGDKPLGPITVLEEDETGARYEVPLLDTAYNRELVPGLQAGLYGSSFRFQVVKEDVNQKPTRSATNPDGLPERTVREAKVMEFGPVTYPAYGGATAGVRSLTDAYIFDRFTRDPERLAELINELQRNGAPALPDDGPELAHSDEGTRDQAPEPEPEPTPDPSPDESPTEETPVPDTEDQPRSAEPPVAPADRPALIIALRAEITRFAGDHTGRLSVEQQNQWDGLTSKLTDLEDDQRAYDLRNAFVGRRGGVPENTETESSAIASATRDYSAVQVQSGRRVRNIYDFGEIRSVSNGSANERQILIDCAKRAIEEAPFSSRAVNGGDKAAGQAKVEHAMATIHDPYGYIPQRILRTGNPVYRRALHKTLMGMMLNPEEMQAYSDFQEFERGMGRYESTEAERAMGQVTGSAGGFGVTFDLDPTMIQTSTGAIVPFRRSARVVNITTNEWRGVTSGGVVAAYAAEAAVASDNSPTLAQPAAIVQKAHCFVPFSMEIQGDYAGLEAELGREIADSKAVLEAVQFVTGAGTTVFPQGILTGATITLNTGTTLVLAAADIYATEFTLSPRFRVNARWAANRAFYNRIRQIDTAGGAQLWTQNLSIGIPNDNEGNTGMRLLGYPADEASGFSTSIATTTLMAAFGDFNYFVIVDRVGMNLELVPILTQQATAGTGFAMPTGQRGLYAWWRNTSKVLSASAFVVLKGL